MDTILQLIRTLRKRTDLEVHEEEGHWRIILAKNDDRVCEVIIPERVLEWFASVKQIPSQETLWSDWMDYEGYDKRPGNELESEMEADILAFLDRTSTKGLALPLSIYEERI